MQNKLMRFVLFFLFFLILFQIFGGKQSQDTNKTDNVIITSVPKYSLGKEVIVQIANHSGNTITIKNNCPENPLKIEYYSNGEWIEKKAELKDASLCKKEDTTILDGKKTKVSFGLWNQNLFDKIGRYRLIYQKNIDGKNKEYYSEIEIKEPSWIKKVWHEALYKPIINTLFFLISKMPRHSLGFAIIILTIIIKLILLAPNQKALKAQKAMQRVQPELDAIKEKYKNNPQKLASETMAIWKKHKVHPMGSCLPMLIQFPILIALFYVVKNGLATADPSILYEPLKGFDITKANTVFLGILDLKKVNFIALPIIVGGLQFFQIRLSLNKTGGKSKKENDPAAMMGKTMQYFMPVMIAVFTASMPAAVGFYWGISTLFAIGQQVVVNRSK